MDECVLIICQMHSDSSLQSICSAKREANVKKKSYLDGDLATTHCFILMTLVTPSCNAFIEAAKLSLMLLCCELF